MYSKPPGLEAALTRDRELADKKAKQEAEAAAAAAAAAGGGSGGAAAGGSSQQLAAAAAGGQQQQQALAALQKQQQEAAMRQRQMDLDKMREDPFAAILAARSALQASEKFVLKSVEGAYGGTLPNAGNQMLLADGDADEPSSSLHQRGGAAAAAAAAAGGGADELDGKPL